MNWNITTDVLPADDTLCKTISQGGMEQDLIYYRGLWFAPDKSMYVYYVPMYWREV